MRQKESRSLCDFQAKVREAGTQFYRDLAWRNTDDPYEVLLSEVMLQQTQVSRVCGRWEHFLTRFPTLDALAAASLSDLLLEWQGLGYNRRALMLKETAEICSSSFRGALPHSLDELKALPGIGDTTAAGVVVFAYNEPAVYLETNVRAVFIHEFFPDDEGIKDAEIRPLVSASCPADNPRKWYYALLDYGAHLKATLPNPSRRSAHYARQSTFVGSRRQKRAELLRIVLGVDEPLSIAAARDALNAFERRAGRECLEEELFTALVDELVREGFFVRENDMLEVCNSVDVRRG